MYGTLADRAHQVLRNSGRIDQRCGPSVLQKEEVAVGRVGILRMMPHVGRQCDVRFPALRGRVGEFAGVESEHACDGARFFFAGNAVAARPGFQIVDGQAGLGGDLCVADPAAAFGLAEYVAEFILEHASLFRRNRRRFPRGRTFRNGTAHHHRLGPRGSDRGDLRRARESGAARVRAGSRRARPRRR